MLALFGSLALACQPSHDGFIDSIDTPEGCIEATTDPETLTTIVSFTNTCDTAGTLTGGAECEGCAVETELAPNEKTEVDFAGVPQEETAAVAFTFTTGDEPAETITVNAVGPVVVFCEGEGCSTAPASLGWLFLLLLPGLRRRR